MHIFFYMKALTKNSSSPFFGGSRVYCSFVIAENSVGAKASIFLGVEVYITIL